MPPRFTGLDPDGRRVVVQFDPLPPRVVVQGSTVAEGWPGFDGTQFSWDGLTVTPDSPLARSTLLWSEVSGQRSEGGELVSRKGAWAALGDLVMVLFTVQLGSRGQRTLRGYTPEGEGIEWTVAVKDRGCGCGR